MHPSNPPAGTATVLSPNMPQHVHFSPILDISGALTVQNGVLACSRANDRAASVNSRAFVLAEVATQFSRAGRMDGGSIEHTIDFDLSALAEMVGHTYNSHLMGGGGSSNAELSNSLSLQLQRAHEALELQRVAHLQRQNDLASQHYASHSTPPHRSSPDESMGEDPSSQEDRGDTPRNSRRPRNRRSYAAESEE